MTTRTIGIVLNGATGRICSTQHLANALAPIRAEGGLPIGADRIVPRLMLIGRNKEKLAALGKQYNAEWTTDLTQALGDPGFIVFFDAAATYQREAVLDRAIAAGKHIYSEKPVATTTETAVRLLRAMNARGLKHGAVEDKIYLPGLQKLAQLVATNFFGRVLGFRIEFGWWIFDGTETRCQRPSWNYQRKGGGGLIRDMYSHWRYVIENLLGPIRRVVTQLSTGIPERIDEQGKRYAVDVEDTATTLVEMASGAIGIILCSWAARVRRDDLLTFQIDGSRGSAIAGVHRCWIQTDVRTPGTAHLSIANDPGINYREHWIAVDDGRPYKNPYRVGWEGFLSHVIADTPMQASFAAGIRDVQFAEACYRSANERAWIDISKSRDTF
jgi:predicted dehydrogenase